MGNQASAYLQKTKPETEDDLVARYSEEVNLDKNYQTQVVGDIESRLAKLREGRGGGGGTSSSGGGPSKGYSK
jgi:hypothetical protein